MNYAIGSNPVLLPKILQRAEDAALCAHLARVDRFADLAEMSFADLLSLEDDLSEGSQWSLLDDVREELKTRREDAKAALRALFVTACDTNGMVPMADKGQVVQWGIWVYMTEALSTGDGLALAVRLALAPSEREQIIGALSLEYASDCADDLLRAGWTQ
jgi:hypothetical protein